MNFETVKSFILLILVVISITLTFGLWYYQPTYDILEDEDDVELETDVGGKEMSISDVIKPDEVIFHNNVSEHYFTFKKPMDVIHLYNNMQSWSISEFDERPAKGLTKEDEQIEIRFPTDLSMELVDSLFSINDDVTLPTWSFNKMFISFDKDSSSLDVVFISSDEDKASVAEIHNGEAYDQLWGYMAAQENMTQLMQYNPDSDKTPIYIPLDSVTMTEYALSIDDINPNMLVNDLFRNPSLVSTTIDESYFTDGQRDMRLLNDKKTIQFIDPYSSYERMEVPDLINQSIDSINNHKGWTSDFYLSDLTTAKNQLEFQMHYEGYPVFSYSNLSVIEQQWRNQDLNLYERPLFQLKNILRQEEKKLDSGERVTEKLSSNPNYSDMSKIHDLKIGYRLSYEESTQSVTLKPAWYVNYDGNWREINFDDPDKKRE